MSNSKVKVAPLPCSEVEFAWAIRQNLIIDLARNAATNSEPQAAYYSAKYAYQFARINNPKMFEPTA